MTFSQRSFTIYCGDKSASLTRDLVGSCAGTGSCYAVDVRYPCGVGEPGMRNGEIAFCFKNPSTYTLSVTCMLPTIGLVLFNLRQLAIQNEVLGFQMLAWALCCARVHFWCLLNQYTVSSIRFRCFWRWGTQRWKRDGSTTRSAGSPGERYDVDAPCASCLLPFA